MDSDYCEKTDLQFDYCAHCRELEGKKTTGLTLREQLSRLHTPDLGETSNIKLHVESRIRNGTREVWVNVEEGFERGQFGKGLTHE